MSLTRMSKQVDDVRFLDDVDIKIASESRSEMNKPLTNISVQVEQELVVRSSYRDILLITTIANNAISLFSSSEEGGNSRQAAFDRATDKAISNRGIGRSSAAPSKSSSKSALHAKVIMATEEVKCFTNLMITILTRPSSSRFRCKESVWFSLQTFTRHPFFI